MNYDAVLSRNFVNQISPNTLYVVATPIGNLGDLSSRAVDVLRSVHTILAEDTRSFRTLADRFGITTPCRSYHEHNEQARTAEALTELRDGSSIALVSDAGTPTISDPGFRLVAACRKDGILVTTIPGPCAAIAALSISGFETDSFVFSGFLPRKPGKHQKALEEALASERATIFYESPFRIVATLEKLATLAPEREIFVARELTKLHEETLRGTAKAIHEQFAARSSIKGEFVLIVRRHPDS